MQGNYIYSDTFLTHIQIYLTVKCKHVAYSPKDIFNFASPKSKMESYVFWWGSYAFMKLIINFILRKFNFDSDSHVHEPKNDSEIN